jgi:hypothetical protein
MFWFSSDMGNRKGKHLSERIMEVGMNLHHKSREIGVAKI